MASTFILYNLYKDSCPLVNHIHYFNFIIASCDKTSHCTPFESATVQKLFTIALGVHITLECSLFSIQSFNVCYKNKANTKE